MTIAGATTAAHGTTTISTDRKSILYKPAAGYSGSDSFSYTVGDNRGGAGQGVVTVAVTNRPPIASPDTFAVIAGKTVKILVLANDRDPDGHRLSVAQVTPAAHGSATVTTDRRGSPTNRPPVTSVPTASPTPPLTAMAARRRPW